MPDRTTQNDSRDFQFSPHILATRVSKWYRSWNYAAYNEVTATFSNISLVSLTRAQARFIHCKRRRLHLREPPRRFESDMVQCTQHVAISFLDVTFEYLSSVMLIEYLHRNAIWDLWQMVKIHALPRFASDMFYKWMKGSQSDGGTFQALGGIAMLLPIHYT
jgi:hypothetical protein